MLYTSIPHEILLPLCLSFPHFLNLFILAMHDIPDDVSVFVRYDLINIELVLEMHASFNVSELLSLPFTRLVCGDIGVIDDFEDLLVELMVRLSLLLELLQSQLLVAFFQVFAYLRDL